jgi:phthalate 4,5-dioxygenase reductase subunit
MVEPLNLRDFKVVSRRKVAEAIEEFTIQALDDAPLSPFTPGAHITLRTPAGAMRRYSLVNDGTDPQTYVLAIKREAGSRGGSQSMHDCAPVGTVLAVGEPDNDFPLVPASRYVLIAGGIGITPIQAMARHLAAQGAPFDLIYCTRTADQAAYLDDVRALPGKITIHHDEGQPGNFFDFWDWLETPSAAHVYCCGPAPLMDEIKALSGHWPEGRVHFEDFKPTDVVRPDDQPFRVTLVKTGQVIDVPADRTILESLREAGLPTVSSCESGTCGTCRCGLVEGDVDHRDMVLRDDQKADNIMICVSRARGGDLVLDL